MKLSELIQNTNCSVISGNSDIEINNLVYDSRKVMPGDVFVCLKGYNIDAHKFAPMAIEKGAAAIVISDDIPVEGVTVIKTDDTREALAALSANFFGHPAKELISIALTGTKGKTTTTCMI